MTGIILSILILTGINPRVAPDRMSTFTFSGGYGNRTGSNVVSGSIALRTNLVVHLSNSLEIGLNGGLYCIEQEQYPGGEDYPLKNGIIHAGVIGRYISQGSRWRFFMEIGSGYYSWNQNFLGYSTGGGIRYYPAGSNYFYCLEGKWHDNIQNLSEPSPGFYTITAGLGFSW
ncbi:MAG: hypothetical protein KAR44_01810 [Candidatus Aegiribacteria sp.]|nr:hypothetical protein [Candidatus Aegiribacteria sp.]